MKVAKKSPPKRRRTPPSARATLTLSREAYRKIDSLRGEASRAAWLQQIIDREVERRERLALAELVRKQYTPEVCRQTLELHDALPIHEG
jgi:hypothetical protein